MSICDLVSGKGFQAIQTLEMGFGAGGGFGDGFSAGNHGLVPDQGRGQQPDLRVPQPYGMDVQTQLPDYGVMPPMILTQDAFPIPGSHGVLITGRVSGFQERIDMSGHDGFPPHLNNDVMNYSGQDSVKAMGWAHTRDLYDTGMDASVNYMKMQEQTFMTDWMKSR